MTGEEGFSVVALELWNSIPKHMYLALSPMSFSYQVKSLLFSQTFHAIQLPFCLSSFWFGMNPFGGGPAAVFFLINFLL